MNRFFAIAICCILLIGCKQTPKPEQQISLPDLDMSMNDTIDITSSDSLQMQEIFEDKTYPEKKQNKELFDDFLISFLSDSLIQASRIVFPLKYINNGEITQMEKTSWRYDNLFLTENCYTLLFDDEVEMESIGDTLPNSVQLDWFHLNEDIVKRYLFQCEDGKWFLNAIEEGKWKNTRNGFIKFYVRFVHDKVYQRNHICLPLQYVTLDPDDEFSILETSLDIEQWFAFEPLLPINFLSNISYGQHNEDDSSTKILKVNGIGNGYSNVYYFRCKSGVWELYRYEDTSI